MAIGLGVNGDDPPAKKNRYTSSHDRPYTLIAGWIGRDPVIVL